MQTLLSFKAPLTLTDFGSGSDFLMSESQEKYYSKAALVASFPLLKCKTEISFKCFWWKISRCCHIVV